MSHGPTTEAGKLIALANLLPGGTAALKHGAFAADGRFMVCDRCPVRTTCEAFEAGGTCALEREYVRDRRAAILGLPFIEEGLDAPAIATLIWQELRIARAARFLAHAGELLPGAEAGLLEYQPLCKDVGALVSSWRATLQALGVTPAERRRLEANGEAGPGAELARAFRVLAEQERQARAGAVDAEVVSETEATDQESDQ